MVAYVTKRLITTLPVAVVASACVFALLFIGGGDPARTMLGPEADQATVARLRAEMGLDRPPAIQYVNWLSNALRGDLGRSLQATRIPVAELVASRLPVTIELAVLATLVALLIAIPLGILSALRRNSAIDIFAAFVAQLGISLPSFFLGLLLIALFAVLFRLVPPSGYVDPLQDPIGNLRAMVLPSITLGAAMAATIMRVLRSSLLEVLSQEYVLTARAKGLKERHIVLKHALKNAAIPVITILGLQIGHLLGGAIVVETVFSLPGVGKLVVDAILVRDFPTVQGVVLVLVFGFLLINLLVDMSYSYLNPRIRAA